MDEPLGTLIAVGKPFPLPLKTFEGLQVWLNPFMAAATFAGLKEKEVQAFRTGDLKLYLQDIDGLMSLVMSIEGLGWCEALIACQSSRNAAFDVPPEDPHMGYMFHLSLVDLLLKKTVKAQRVIGLSNEFSRGLYAIWLRHRNDPQFTEASFQEVTASLIKRYDDPAELAQRATYRYYSR